MSDRLSLRSLSLSLAAVLVCGGLTANLRSADAAPPVVAAEDSDSTSVMAEAQSSGSRVEDVEQRTETTQVFANPDGTWTSEIATTPVRVQDASGSWEDVDLTLEERDGVIAPKVSATEVVFSDGGDRMLAQVSEDGKDLAWRLPGSDAVLPEPVLDGPTATYPEIAPGQDLIVTATPTGFSHSVILRERPDLAPGESLDIAMPVTTDGANLTETAQGGLQLTTDSGEFVVGAPRPMMWDSSEGPSGQSENVAPVDVTVTQPGNVTPEGNTAGSSPVVTLSPDESFLTDPDTQYPVTVDPTYSTTSNGDTWVQNLDFTSSQAGSDELRAGTFDAGTHKARSWLRFSTTALAGKKINSATMSLLNWWSQTCSGSAVRVSRVTSDWVGVPTSGRPLIAWNNQPSFTYTDAADSSTAKGYSGSCPGGWVGWDLTTIVQGWADGSFTNHGLRVSAVNETVNSGWRRFRSTNYASNNPTLSVNYNSYPSTPSSLTLSPVRGSSTPYSTPTLSAVLSDPDGGSVKGEFRLYNVEGDEIWAAESASVTSGATGSVQVPDEVLDVGQTYTFKVSTSDGSLFSGPSSPKSFGYNPTVSIVPASSCGSDCHAIENTPLLPETTLMPGEARQVAVVLPGITDVEIDRVFLTVSMKNWSATGSLTVADPSYAAGQPPTLSYGASGSPTSGASSTVEAFPSYDGNQVVVTNNGSASIDVTVSAYGWIGWINTVEEELESSEEWLEEYESDSDSVVIEDEDYFEVASGPPSVAMTAQQIVVAAEEAAADESSGSQCPEGTEPGSKCVAVLYEDLDPELTVEEVEAQENLVEGVALMLTDPLCKDVAGVGSSKWRVRGRYNACRNTYWTSNYVEVTATGGTRQLGQTFFAVQEKFDLDGTNASIQVSYRPYFLKGWGIGTSMTTSHAVHCGYLCDAQWDEWRTSEVVNTTNRAGAWVSETKVSNVSSNEIRSGSVNIEFSTCGVANPAMRTCTIGSRPVYGNEIRCDSKAYLQRGKGCVFPSYVPTFVQFISGGRAPESATHIRQAQAILDDHPGRRADGIPLTRMYDPPARRANRREAMRICASKRITGSCDEYPYASTKQGCAKHLCHVKGIDKDDNFLGGTFIGKFYGRVRALDGDKFWVRIVL